MSKPSSITPFYNMDMECAFLGAILIHGVSVFDPCKGVLGAGDFYTPRHGYIYEAMTTLSGDIDILTVSDRLASMGRLSDCGGDAYLAELMASHYVMMTDVTSIAQTLKGYSVRRQAFKVLQSAMSELSTHTDDNPTEQVHNVISALQKIEMPTAHEDYKTIFRGFVDKREMMLNNPDEIDGISWGFPLFDDTFGTIKAGNLIGIAGQTKARKSTLMAWMAKTWLERGHVVGFINLEMMNDELLSRLEEMVTGVNFKQARKSQNKADIDKLMRGWSKMYNWSFGISDKPLTVDAIPAKLMQWKRELGRDIEILFVDYSGLVELPKSERIGADWERQMKIIKGLKNLAQAEGIIVISAMQLNMDGYGNTPPKPSDIGGTIAYGQTVNTMLALWRPDEHDNDRFNILHMLSRDMPAGQVVKMWADGLTLKILTDRIEP